MGKTLTANQKKTLVEVFPFKWILTTSDAIRYYGIDGVKDCSFFSDSPGNDMTLLFEHYKKDPKAVKALKLKENMNLWPDNKDFVDSLNRFETKSEKKKFALTFFDKSFLVVWDVFNAEDFSWSKNEIDHYAWRLIGDKIVDWYLRDKNAVKPLLKQMKEVGQKFKDCLPTEDAFKKFKSREERIEFFKDFGLCNFDYELLKKYFDMFEYMDDVYEHLNQSKYYAMYMNSKVTKSAIELYMNDKAMFLKRIGSRKFRYECGATNPYFKKLKTLKEKEEFLSFFGVRFDTMPVSSFLYVDNGKMQCLSMKDKYYNSDYIEKVNRILFASSLPSFNTSGFLKEKIRLDDVTHYTILDYIADDNDKRDYILKLEIKNMDACTVLRYVPVNKLDKVKGKFTYTDINYVAECFIKDNSLAKKKIWNIISYKGDKIDSSCMKKMKSKEEKTEFVRMVGLYHFKPNQVFKHIDCDKLFTLEYFNELAHGDSDENFDGKYHDLKTFSTPGEVRAILNLYIKYPEQTKKIIHESLCKFSYADPIVRYGQKLQDEKERWELEYTFFPQWAVHKKWREFLDTREDGYEFNFHETVALIQACIEHPDAFRKKIKGRNFVFDNRATLSFDEYFVDKRREFSDDES